MVCWLSNDLYPTYKLCKNYKTIKHCLYGCYEIHVFFFVFFCHFLTRGPGWEIKLYPLLFLLSFEQIIGYI